ncbi:hypothetical protein A8135_13085 [Legionella jamestowniensis]|nr:DUF1868 domain-containing protein [Legionella jamestowniensis]OCH98089.1 hypothetical protein A8135_13085 [Legionella jamestowniensis]
MFKSKNPNSSARPLCKIDEAGNFGYFPGITVVSSLYPTHRELCSAIHAALEGSSLIKEYFSLLPAESYHMTMMDLQTKEGIGDSWNEFISQNLSENRKIIQELQTNRICPSIEKMKINIAWSLSIHFVLPEEQEKQIRDVAKTLNLEKKVPYVFHMTLAYLRPNKEISEAVADQLENEIKQNISSVINSITMPMKLAEPQLCYFNDMTCFYPWDATYNPFSKLSSFQNSWFGFLSKKKNSSDKLVNNSKENTNCSH